MKVIKYYLDCLSHSSYIVISNNEAVVIDPQRDVDEYVEYLNQLGLTLKYILETHLHADFVSGHLELAKKTNSQIVFSKVADVSFEHIGVSQNDVLTFGNVDIKILETPGHTPEGISYVMNNLNDSGQELAVFTGDTLFAGDVGRPDLMDETITKEELGGLLFDSLRNKIMTLPDDTKVYPAHGAGSSCGKQLLDVEFTTIGYEKSNNYALQEMTKKEFIELVTTDQPIPPKYFSQSAILNRLGLVDVDEILNNFHSIDLGSFEKLVEDTSVTLLDVRDPDVFCQGYIPGSLNIGLDGRYAEWVGSVIDPEQKIVFVVDEGKEIEAAKRATRVGFDNVIGYLEGGYDAWLNSKRKTEHFDRIDVNDIDRLMKENPDMVILDVRRPTEFRISHFPNAINIPLRILEENLDQLDPDKDYIVNCAGGYRSVIASSILLTNKFTKIKDLRDGFDAYLKIKSVELHAN